ncbi:MAG TPA: carboxypeptidase regulatory-like domain-containing protein [Mesonia sp.]|nr:carboxypeptidase regulatory-like domain-containing protein [Mesonia sp.]HIO26858.1 carboxypeptidase regulatory-like domain-containing protein [Flavobacteriaceae bacterium]
MNKTLLSILIIFCIFISSCNNDDDFTQTNDDQEITDPSEDENEPVTIDLSENFGNEVSRNFIGQIVDGNQNPIPNVIIEIAEVSTTTDENGIFILNEANVYENFAYIKASKPGYVNGSRALIPTEGINQIRIMLLEKNIAATIESGTSSVVTNENGASVEFDGNFINDETEETYTGNIKVSFHYLNPEDDNMTSQMPGMLYAANAENEERMLQTFGMLAVELEGENGEKLNLAETSEATIRVPLSSALSANAPATIPLWYFNEDKGYWIEDGEATLQGNEYVGTVSHFSFWNCDIPAEAVNYCLTITDENNIPISQVRVSIDSEVYGTRSGITNNDGEVCGLIPSGETLEINFYFNEACSTEPFYSANIGPFNDDASETLNINLPADNEVILETITGTFNNCEGNPVTNGYITMTSENNTFDNFYASVEEDGSFEISVLNCQNNSGGPFILEGNDYDNFQTTGNISYTFTTPTTNVGSLVSCNEVEEFIQYSIDNGETEFYAFSDIEARFETLSPNYNAPLITIFASGSGNNCFYLMGILNEDPYLGEYSYYNWTSQEEQVGFDFSECSNITSGEDNNIIINLNSLGEVGEYIDINFSGDYLDWNENPHTITGTIHVYRDQ